VIPGEYGLGRTIRTLQPGDDNFLPDPLCRGVTLRVYDVLGREVATLVDGYQSAGTHTKAFDGSRLSSGVYFYRLQSGAFVNTKKMVLAK